MSKICSKCERLLDFSNFYLNKTYSDGRTANCIDCLKLYKIEYYKNNKQKYIERQKIYASKNKLSISKKSNIRSINRRKTDPLYYLRTRLSIRLGAALKVKFWKKDTKFSQYIGCSLNELKAHLENQFKLGMAWENRGEWHIDHIIPLSSAKTKEEMIKLSHYTNLQPLWALENFKKGSRYV